VRYFLAFEEDNQSIFERDDYSGPASARETLFRSVDDAWPYLIRDGRTESTTANRQRHIIYGQNLAAEYALEHGADLFMVGSSVMLPPGIIYGMQMLADATQLNFQPILGPYVPSYAQHRHGTERTHYGTTYFQGLPAGAMLVPHRMLAAGLRWRTHSGMSDDFTLVKDAEDRFGCPSYVSLSTQADKYPATVIPLEQRGYDRRTS
jgi:hypothetical protein